MKFKSRLCNRKLKNCFLLKEKLGTNLLPNKRIEIIL